MRRLRAILAAVLVAAAGLVARPAGAGPEPAAPSGYRLGDYRAPTPAGVPGGRAIDTAAAKALWESGRAVWVDVLPAPRRPEGQREDAIWAPLPHRSVPGSVWLPEVGRGELSPELDAWFRARLAAATGGDRRAAIVLYCLADCWMSWNATRRAASYGYADLYWYRDGMDGWEAAGLPTAVTTPAPGAP